MSSVKTRIVVGLSDTDAAGLIFFTNQFHYAHAAYEQFLEHIDLPMKQIIDSEDFLIPIIHAESDYHQKLEVGDRFDLELTVDKVGESSFTLFYILTNPDGNLVGTAKTIHVTIDKNTKNKIALPDQLRKGLIAFKSMD